MQAVLGLEDFKKIMDLALRRITLSCAKKEGESRHVIVVTSKGGSPHSK